MQKDRKNINNIKNIIPTVRTWGPVVAMMGIIFTASSIPGNDLPDFHLLDTLVKKGGHMLGYALLALSLLRALRSSRGDFPILSVLVCVAAFAASDELHQYFVPGRHSRLTDVGIDLLGALLGLVVYRFIASRLLSSAPPAGRG